MADDNNNWPTGTPDQNAGSDEHHTDANIGANTEDLNTAPAAPADEQPTSVLTPVSGSATEQGEKNDSTSVDGDPQTGTVPPGTTIWCVRADIPAGDDAHPTPPQQGAPNAQQSGLPSPDTEQSAEHAIWRARGPEPAERATGCTECAEPQSVRCANGQSVRAQQRHAGRSGQSERPDTVAVRPAAHSRGNRHARRATSLSRWSRHSLRRRSAWASAMRRSPTAG